MSNLRWKVITVVAVTVIFFAVGVWPLIAQRYGITQPSWLMDKALKLGLDLKGGVHLVLRVQTDDALRLTTQQEMERLRETLKSRQITVGSMDATDIFTMKPNVQVTLRDESVVQARETIERRVNELGVTEPSIAQQGTNGD